ncbi:hypothetical protein F5Y12DRAFT_725303 [Xylaria sp. FL1777]|nr:hypothetical protein F5Y12DRAFT_725303 [Xylaria sp. FL1777]
MRVLALIFVFSLANKRQTRSRRLGLLGINCSSLLCKVYTCFANPTLWIFCLVEVASALSGDKNRQQMMIMIAIGDRRVHGKEISILMFIWKYTTGALTARSYQLRST